MSYLRCKVSELPPALQTAAKALSRKKSAIIHTATSVSLATGWEGGSRSSFSLVRLSDGKVVQLSGNSESAWCGSRRTTPDQAIEPGFAIVDCGTFLGKPAAPSFALLESDFARLFPPAPELEERQDVLCGCGWGRLGQTQAQLEALSECPTCGRGFSADMGWES